MEKELDNQAKARNLKEMQSFLAQSNPYKTGPAMKISFNRFEEGQVVEKMYNSYRDEYQSELYKVLFQTVKKGDIVRLQHCVKRFHFNVEEKDINGNTLLNIAA